MEIPKKQMFLFKKNQKYKNIHISKISSQIQILFGEFKNLFALLFFVPKLKKCLGISQNVPAFKIYSQIQKMLRLQILFANFKIA